MPQHSSTDSSSTDSSTADPATADPATADGADGADGAPTRDVGRQSARWSAVIVGVVLLLFIGVLATRKPADQKGISSPLVGKAVPALAGTTIDGKRFDIDDYRGRYVVVNFFATWCVPCTQEHPELVAFQQEHAAKGDAVVVSVAFNDTEENISAFFAKNGGDWPVIGGDTGPTILDFGVVKVPESYVVAPSRQVVAKFTGVTQAGLNEVLADIGKQVSGPR